MLHVRLDGNATADSAIAEVMHRRVSTVAEHADANVLPTIFERGEVALVVDDERRIRGILTKLDLIDFHPDSEGKPKVWWMRTLL